MEHIIGKPIFKEQDKVKFDLTLEYDETTGLKRVVSVVGTICIVDAYGTFEQNEEPSYDIMVDDWLGTGEPCLVKHIRESQVESCD